MSRSRDKGTLAETKLAQWLQANGWPWAERRTLYGSSDRGDITGVPGVAIEVKNVKQPTYTAWLREAEAERINANAQIGVLVHKPHGMSAETPGEWIVVMRVKDFFPLLQLAGITTSQQPSLHPQQQAGL